MLPVDTITITKHRTPIQIGNTVFNLAKASAYLQQRWFDSLESHSQPTRYLRDIGIILVLPTPMLGASVALEGLLDDLQDTKRLLWSAPDTLSPVEILGKLGLAIPKECDYKTNELEPNGGYKEYRVRLNGCGQNWNSGVAMYRPFD